MSEWCAVSVSCTNNVMEYARYIDAIQRKTNMRKEAFFIVCMHTRTPLLGGHSYRNYTILYVKHSCPGAIESCLFNED